MFRVVLLGVFTALGPGACGTNPVTHKTEFQPGSESKEIAIEQQNYVPARQQQGGDCIIDPEAAVHSPWR